MSNLKGKVSLFLVIIMMMTSILPIFTVSATENATISLTAKYGNTTLKDRGSITAKAGDKISITVDAPYTEGLKIGYFWNDGTMQILSSGSKTGVITVPNFAAGTKNELQVQAILNNDANNVHIKTDKYNYEVKIPAAVVTPVPTPEISLTAKYGNTTLKDKGSITAKAGDKINITVDAPYTDGLKIGYFWNDGTMQILSSGSKTGVITVPNFAAGTKNALQVQAILNNDANNVNIKTSIYNFEIKIPSNVVVNPPAEEIDDELITEEWMKESSELDALSVSLRNGSDEDKQNKNIYVLGEEVIYYIDYANGTSKDIDNAKIVFETELAFDVVDAFGGKVDGKKVTWEFPNGIEEGQTGTKVLVLKYNSLGKSSVKSKVINPVADIYKGTKVADSSAVINLIFKDEETEITNDEHYPYMKGDADKPTFRPDDGITRAEGALVLTRIFGMSTSGTTVSNEYSDLGETYLEAQKAIVAASKAGLINGYEDGTYKPNKKMTRAEFMKIIAANIELVAEEDDVRGLEIKTSDEEIKIYKDPTKSYVVGNATVNEHWASSYVTFLARLNMTSASKKEKDLRLDEPITRAEVAQLVNFYLLRAPAEDVKTTQFTDVSKNHKLFGDIVEATRDAHTYFLTVEGTEIVED